VCSKELLQKQKTELKKYETKQTYALNRIINYGQLNAVLIYPYYVQCESKKSSPP